MIEIIDVVEIIEVAAIIGFIFLFVQIRLRGRASKNLRLNIDSQIKQAIGLSCRHDQISTDFLRRAMRITRKDAEAIVNQLIDSGIVEKESKNGIHKVMQ